MKRRIGGLLLGGALLALGGCVYDYQRPGVVYDDGTTVYDDGYAYAPGYYYYAPAYDPWCCWGWPWISLGFYGTYYHGHHGGYWHHDGGWHRPPAVGVRSGSSVHPAGTHR
jgi:hypothetical protein